ncbi:dolichol-phosphate mannosyltransferase subunit 3 [Ilyonectria robusta]
MHQVTRPDLFIHRHRVDACVDGADCPRGTFRPLWASDGRLIQGQLPFWALVSFGAYLLFRLGLGILTFNDVPDAHKELMQEIDEAKVDLRKLGVDVD